MALKDWTLGTTQPLRSRSAALARPAFLAELACLAFVVALAGALNAWSLSTNGYGNVYYAAAVRSMTASWSNFFFGAFDPGGFITVDKPPAFLWVDALSARIFGYSSWSIMLPSALAGAASVGVLWSLVRKYFGVVAGTVAALVLALTPVCVAVNRLNLPEPFMILALVCATAATIRSFDSKRWWAWIALAGVLVGVAFNVKMLAAWIPGPALALAVVAATRSLSLASLRSLAARLAILAVVTFAVSASWMVVVDLWPESHRPYVGGSTDNTVVDLALGYNGFGRVEGEAQGFGGGGGNRPSFDGGGGAMRPDGGSQLPDGTLPPDGGVGNGGAQPDGTGGQFPNGNSQSPDGAFDGGAQRGGGAATGFRGAGGIVAGLPGLLRMFDDANGGQIGWMLAFGVIGGAFALWHWRRDAVRRGITVLFLGWVLTYAFVFSFAEGIYHSYYTSAMAPGIAALCGIAVVAMSAAVRRNRWWLIAPVALVGLTLMIQLELAGRTPDFYGWMRPLTVAGALVGLGIAALLMSRGRTVASGLAISVLALLLIPGAWSFSVAANASLNTTLPQAGPQAGASGGSFGSDAFDDGTDELAAWLLDQDDGGTTWQLVVSSAQNASRLIAEHGISVMAIGGFLGQDDSITVDEFADLVAASEVRYVQAGGGFGSGGGGGFAGAGSSAAQAVMSAVQESCTPVSDVDLPTSYQGSIYDCAGAAEAIRQAGAQ